MDTGGPTAAPTRPTGGGHSLDPLQSPDVRFASPVHAFIHARNTYGTLGAVQRLRLCASTAGSRHSLGVKIAQDGAKNRNKK